MKATAAVFNLLRTIESPAADRALVAALSAAEPAEPAQIDPIVETLVARDTREALCGLIACWHKLSDARRADLLTQRERLFTVLRETSNHPEEQIRFNMIEVVRVGRLYRAAYLLDSALHDRSVRIRQTAAAALHELTDALLSSAPVALPIAADPVQIRARMADLEARREDRRQLAAAIEAGLVNFDLHQQSPVLEAAMWLVEDAGGALWKTASVPGSKAAKAARAILEKGRHPRLVPFMMMALNYNEFRAYVLQTLATCTDLAFLTEWFRQGWRFTQARMARGLATVKELACAGAQAAALLALPEDVQRHLSRSLLNTNLPAEQKAELLKELARRAQPAGRRAAAWGLTHLSVERATALLRSMAAQADSELAAIARYELARRKPAEYPPRVLRPAAQSTAGSSAAEPAVISTFDEYWLAFDRLPDAQRLLAGQQLMAQDRLNRATLGRRLAGPEAADRVRALRIARLLGLTAELEDAIYRLSHDPDADIRSAAIAALGTLPTATSRRLLRAALYDADTRVQANAVEAVGELDPAAAGAELMPKLASTDNRVRANAVRALLKLGVREAAETLLHMLRDPNRAQRVSALWLVEHMGLFTLAQRVFMMAATDDDPDVRSRAQQLAGRLPADKPDSAVPAKATPEAVPC